MSDTTDRGTPEDPATPADPDSPAERAQSDSADELSAWERKRRLAEIFGDVLPATTRDERGQGSGDSGESANDAWLRRQVPPHHGG